MIFFQMTVPYSFFKNPVKRGYKNKSNQGGQLLITAWDPSAEGVLRSEESERNQGVDELQLTYIATWTGAL